MPNFNNRDNRNRDNRNRDNRNNQGHGYNNPPLPSNIPSPYNFVELSDFVYFPDWAEQISHDVPFSDGISGTIEIKATTKTECYTRNSGNFTEDDIKKAKRDPKHPYNDFFNVDELGYFIPATSFKGVISSIIEISSFGKMAKSKVDGKKRYSIRDLTFNPYTKEMTENLGNRTFQSYVKAGWLVQEKENEDKWELFPCDYARVEQNDLETYHGGIQIGQNRESSFDKYIKWKKPLNINCVIDEHEKKYHHSCGQLIYKKVYNLGKGKDNGILVFTGQASPRRNRNAKHMEFVFFNKSNNPLDVSQLKKDFEFIHSENGNPNAEWSYWKKKIEKSGEVPVFYLEDNDGKPESMGLAMMYRLPYFLNIEEAIANSSPDSNYDDENLVEAIFGHTNEYALKGRVHISHLKCEDEPKKLPLVKTVLGSPKPTYYPNYIKQETDGRGNTRYYKTLLDHDAEINGRKRYIVRKDGEKPQPIDSPTESVATTFIPIKEGTVFKGKIKVHNLRPEELGALIWALTWGGNEKLRHNIGMAKPYGYGSIKVEIESINFIDVNDNKNFDVKTLQDKFIKLMEDETKKAGISGGWKNSKQIKQLKNMADPNYKHPHDLEYIKMGKGRGNNHFVEFKKAKKALLEY